MMHILYNCVHKYDKRIPIYIYTIHKNVINVIKF